MNKILLIATLSVFPLLSQAAEVVFGRIVDIKGSGFISYAGKTHEIKKGEVIYANSELIVEHSGQVSFTDNADHRFHLGNSSTAAIYAGKVELRSGDVWVQSLNKVEDYVLTTANASVTYQGGEAILSYDSVKGKTQLMVINGLMKLSNLRSPELNLSVAEGNFSFVDPSFEEGMPRDPTPVGEKTYGQLVSMFTAINPMDKKSAEIFKDHPATGHSATHATTDAAPAKREIASVPADVHELEKVVKAEMLKMKKSTHVSAAPVKKSAASGAKKLVVKIYGQNGMDASVTTAIYDIPFKESTTTTLGSTRAPASVPEVEPSVAAPGTQGHSNMNTIPTTPKYKESDKLIDELNKL